MGPQLSFEDARTYLAAQPFSVLLGTRLTAFDDEGAVLELDVREDLLQQNGYVHGGVLAYAADNALTFAGGSALGPAVLTGGFTISYLRPARGQSIRAHATVVHASKSQAVCRCDVHAVADDGRTVHCATAQGTIVAVPDRQNSATGPG